MIDEKFWQEYERANSNPLARFLNSNKIEQMEKMIIGSSTFVSKDSPEFEKWSSEINLSGINIESISLRQNYLEKQYSILSKSTFHPRDKLSEIRENINLIISEKEVNQEVFDTLEAFEYFDSLPENPEFVPTETQANLLPNGWTWVVYPDGSGHLTSADGFEYDSYDEVKDVKEDVEIEVRNAIEKENLEVGKVDNEKDNLDEQSRIEAPVIEIRRNVSSEIGGLSTSKDLTR